MSYDDRSATAKRAERRLAAILAADVVGYSRLMERDEEGTHERLRALIGEVARPQIEEHRGRVVKTTGDGLLAEFASAMEAVRCAVAMQQAMAAHNRTFSEERRMAFRMGINLGDILIEDGDVFGEGVNLAARLEGLADAGGILVSHTIHDHVRGKLPFRFDDLGERSVKNIERPVRVFRVGWDADSERDGKQPDGERPPSTKLALAVLPFTNMSSDPEQEFFADGLAEDLITDLSKVSGLMVIARNSSFVFKGKSVDIRSVAKDLGVRYVIEGSVRRASGRVRINAQLIDATDNSHIWADRFDSDLADIFVLQDEVVGRIVNALAGVLPTARPVGRQRASNLEAYDLFVRGRVLIFESAEGNREARSLFQRSIALDPDFAEAQAWLAIGYVFAWLHWGSTEEDRLLALAAARKAVSLDQNDAVAHTMLAYVLMFENKLQEAASEFAKALQIDPNYADAWAFRAELRMSQGDSEAGIEAIQHALRLNPHPPSWYYWILGLVQYGAGRYEEAVVSLQHPTTRQTTSQRLLAASLAQLGRIDEAKAEAAQFLARTPTFSTARWANAQPFARESDRERFIEGYIKAGLPA